MFFYFLKKALCTLKSGLIKFDDDLLADGDFSSFSSATFVVIRPQDLAKWLGAWLDVEVELLVVVELAAGGQAVVLQVREGEPGEVFVELVDSVIVGPYP